MIVRSTPLASSLDEAPWTSRVWRPGSDGLAPLAEGFVIDKNDGSMFVSHNGSQWGSHIRLVTPDGEHDLPDRSPDDLELLQSTHHVGADGRPYVLYAAPEPGTPCRIYSVEAGDLAPYHQSEDCYDFLVLPDWILLQGDRTRLVEPGTGATRDLAAEGENASYVVVDWKSDGISYTVAQETDTGRGDWNRTGLRVMHLPTGATHQLVDGGTSNTEAHALDGDTLYVLAERHGRSRLWVMDLGLLLA